MCYNQNNLTDLWHRYAKTGDPGIINTIYDDIHLIVYMVAYKYLRDKDKAADVTQDVFLKLIKNRKLHGNVRNFEAWISTITRNECFKRLEAISKNLDRFLPITEEHHRTIAVSSNVFKKFETELVISVINKLKQKHFRKILLFTMSGKTNGEIALSLRKSEKYVRDRKSMAMKALKEAILRLTDE